MNREPAQVRSEHWRGKANAREMHTWLCQASEFPTFRPPGVTSVPRKTYSDRVAEIALSEQAGCHGHPRLLDNSPSIRGCCTSSCSRRSLPSSRSSRSTHPHIAKKIASFYLYGRRFYPTWSRRFQERPRGAQRSHATRQAARTARRIHLDRDAPAGQFDPLTCEGEFHGATRLKLTPSVPEALIPGVFVSGSSDAGMAAAKALCATAIKYPGPAGEEKELPADDLARLGIRVGIIARERDDQAWAVAHARFPEDRKGQITHQLAMKVSDSAWHKQLSARESGPQDSPYWLVPFQNYKTMSISVGTRHRGGELSPTSAPHHTFILTCPSIEKSSNTLTASRERARRCVRPTFQDLVTIQARRVRTHQR